MCDDPDNPEVKTECSVVMEEACETVLEEQCRYSDHEDHENDCDDNLYNDDDHYPDYHENENDDHDHEYDHEVLVI